MISKTWTIKLCSGKHQIASVDLTVFSYSPSHTFLHFPELLSAEVSCENCFDWLSMLKYSMQISPILRAKTFVPSSGEKPDILLHRERSLRMASDGAAGRNRTPQTPLTHSPHTHTPVSRRKPSYVSGGKH